MPWLALPFENREAKEKLSKKYKVQGIPSFVILSEDGTVITQDGREAVSKDPTGERFPWIPPTFAEALGTTFLQGESEVGLEAVAGKTLGLYFSAHWCPPCRGFTPNLAAWYAKIKPELGEKFEIIFCSGDQDEASMKSYYKEQCDAGGTWLCLPYSNKDSLDGRFQVQGIPTFIIVSPDGKIINKSARSLIPDAVAADFPWVPPAVGDVESPDGLNESPAMMFMLEGCQGGVQQSIFAAAEKVAKEYTAQEEPEMIFFAARKPGSVSAHIRNLCSLDPPSETPKLVLLDIPDNGGYYVAGQTELDEGSIRAMIQDWKDKKLERKQMS